MYYNKAVRPVCADCKKVERKAGGRMNTILQLSLIHIWVAFVEGGLLSISIQPLVMGVFFCYIAGLSLVRRGIERRREQREE